MKSSKPQSVLDKLNNSKPKPQPPSTKSRSNKTEIQLYDDEDDEDAIEQSEEETIVKKKTNIKKNTITNEDSDTDKEDQQADTKKQVKVGSLTKQASNLSICETSEEEEEEEEEDEQVVQPLKRPLNRKKILESDSDDNEEDDDDEDQEEENEQSPIKSSKTKPLPSSRSRKPIVVNIESDEEEEEEEVEEEIVNKHQKKKTTATTTTTKSFASSSSSRNKFTDDELSEEEEALPKRLGRLRKPQQSKSKSKQREEDEMEDDEEEEEEEEEEDSDPDFVDYSSERKSRSRTTQRRKTSSRSTSRKQKDEDYESDDDEEEEEEENDYEEDQSESDSEIPAKYDIKKLVDQLNGFVKDDSKKLYINSKQKGDKYFTMKAKVYDSLFWYQRDGVNWLWNLFCRKAGGILGDDMGLGKTMQICSFLNSMHSQGHITHSLLVMPVGLIEQWLKEFRRFNPKYPVKVFHGSNKSVRQKSLSSVMSKGGIVITTYGMVVSNVDLMTTRSRKIFTWDYIILDEGHKIKETKTKISKALHEFTAHHKIIMTGTAIQNNLRELWALFNWVCEGTLLGTVRDFTKRFSNPIIKGHTNDITQQDKIIGSAIAEDLRRIIAPHFLRREKKDVFKNQDDNGEESGASQSQQKDDDEKEEIIEFEEHADAGENDGDDGDDDDDDFEIDGVKTPSSSSSKKKKTPIKVIGRLTPSRSLRKKRMSIIGGGIKTRKNDFVVWTKLADSQIELYKIFLESDEVKDALNKTQSALAALTVLKKICDHPHLLREEMKMITIEEMKGLLAKIGGDRSVESLVANSGKFQLLLELLPNLHIEGHRVLMFSQSKKMLDDFEIILEHLDLKYLRIDGDISSTKKRQDIIDLYNTDHSYFAFILTIQVGALGLNLTSADRVLILDPSWNTVDNQAVDRAYRIGQKKNVVVYRLMSCGTIEEKIYRKQVFKGSLMKTMLNSNTGLHRYFSANDLRELFRLDDTKTSQTQRQLEALHSKNRKSSPDLDKHLKFLTDLDVVFGVSDHDLLFTEAVQTDHSENDFQQIKEGTFGGSRPNKKKTILTTRNTPNKTQIRNGQYIHVGDHGHEEEDLQEDIEEYPELQFRSTAIGGYSGFDQSKFIGMHSTMSPAPVATKTKLRDVSLGSKRKGNQPIEILDEDEEPISLDDSIGHYDGDDNDFEMYNTPIKNNNRTTTTTTTSTNYNNKIVISIDDDDDEVVDQNQVSVQKGKLNNSNTSSGNASGSISSSDKKELEMLRSCKHFNYLISKSKEAQENSNLILATDLIIEAEKYAQEHKLNSQITNDEMFKNLVKDLFKKVAPPTK